MRYWLRSSFSQSCDPPPQLALLEELETCNEEELLQEDLRVEDGNVGSSADERVGCVGQGVNDIISHQIAVFVLEDWQQQVFNHLGIHGTLQGARTRILFDIAKIEVKKCRSRNL